MTDNRNQNSTSDQHVEDIDEEAVDGGPVLDADDRRAERRLAERAGLIPTRKVSSAPATTARIAKH